MNMFPCHMLALSCQFYWHGGFLLRMTHDASRKRLHGSICCYRKPAVNVD